MRRTNIVELRPSPSQRRILKEMMLLSSCVYNMANYEFRQAIFNKEKVSSFFKIKSNIQKNEAYQLLGRCYGSPRIQIYSEMVDSYFKLIKSQKQINIGLPNYLKNRKTNTTIPSYLVIDGESYNIKKNKVMIPLSVRMRKKYNFKKKEFNINYNGVLRWKGKQCRGQIRFEHGKLYLYQSVELPDVAPVSSDVFASIDLGIKNLITTVTSTGEECIIGSKRFFKEFEYHSSLINKEQARLATINRMSSNKLQSLCRRRSVYQNHLFNNIVAKTFRFYKRNDVQTIYIGDLKGMCGDKNKGALINRMINNYWSYGKLLQKIKNKAEEQGIKVVLLDESYTSQECTICTTRNKPKDRIYICDFCGNIEHRDILGATNILMKGMCDLQGQSTQQDETILLRGDRNVTA